MSESGSESFYYLTRDEIKKLILCASSLRDRVIIKILARTGIRRGELRDLEIRDVDFDKRRIYIRSGKGDKSRTVPIDTDSLQDIKFYIGERESGKRITICDGFLVSLQTFHYGCMSL